MPRWLLLQRGGFYSSLSSPLLSCPASPLLSPLGLEPVPWLVPPLCSVLPPAGVPPLGLEPPPSEQSPGVVGVLRFTLALPALMALMTAACALRLATRLNLASARRFLNSLPGYTWFSLIDFKEVNVHWTHGNAVIIHTFVCFDGWYFNSQKPHFLLLFWGLKIYANQWYYFP